MQSIRFTPAVCVLAFALPSAAQTTTRLSDTSTGAEGGGYGGVISENGRFVAFESSFTLVPNDVNGYVDVYLRDLLLQQTTLVSRTASGASAKGTSTEAAISGDGNLIAFTSDADNLVVGDTNSASDIFLRDVAAQTTILVSKNSAGIQGDRDSTQPSLTPDGRFVTFSSKAQNLVAGDLNGFTDIFVRDLQTGITTRESLDSNGAEANSNSGFPCLSADGRYVAFRSFANNLVAGDTNAAADDFVRDRQTGVTTRVSVATNGTQADADVWIPRISNDGRYVAFDSYASTLVAGDTGGFSDVFVHDMLTAETTRVSVTVHGLQGNQNSFYPSNFSSDGRWLAFSGPVKNFAGGDNNSYSDVFLLDRASGQITCVSRTSANDDFGGGNSGWPKGPSLSGDGHLVVFDSDAYDLAPGESIGFDYDVFVRDIGCSVPTVYCTAKVNSLGCTPWISLSNAPSASKTLGANVVTMNVRGASNGLFFHHVGAARSFPFHGGWLCVGSPSKRHALHASGAGSTNCQGLFSESLNAYIASGADPALVAGATVNLQCWARDPAAPFTDSLSDAVSTVICP